MTQTPIALSWGLIFVTRNVRNFQRVPELTTENWIDETWKRLRLVNQSILPE